MNDELVVNLEKARPAKPKKEKKKKAVKITENRGITGLGTDYTVYILSGRETFFAVLLGFAAGIACSYAYFGSKILSLMVGLIIGYKAISIYRNYQLKKRIKELRLQFRDMLESLSNSYTVGMTASRAFHAAYADMAVEHGEKAYITKELRLICTSLDNQGIEIKDTLNDLAKRSGIDDVKSFAGVFEVSSNLGGDVAKIIRETRDIISDKIETELEIQTMVTGQRNQLNILAIMPIVISILTNSFGVGTGNILVYIVKVVALGLFIFAYWLGNKIVDIKV